MATTLSELELPFAQFTKYPLLPLRDTVVFPNMIAPMLVGREKSIAALDAAMKSGKLIVVATQKDVAVDEPEPKDINQIGTLCKIFQHVKMADDTVRVLLEGISRVRIGTYIPNQNYLEVLTEKVEQADKNDANTMSLAKSLMSQFENYVKLNRKIPPEVMVSLNQLENPQEIADAIVTHLPLKITERQKILETISVSKRLDMLFAFIESEIGVLQVERKIKRRVRRQMEKTQREYYLNEQMKAIQKELGDIDDADEVARIEKRIRKVKLSKEAKDKANTEIRKLRQMSLMSAEATVLRNYLDVMLDLPWNKYDKIDIDLIKAKEILDADHYGLEKVKERIIEYIAVQQRTGQVKGPILCLVGPPGVGKTSLGQSIARAIGRKYVRASLGGVRDEAEIRGHRRTYIGAMPGKVLQSMKKAETCNPLFLLDEIDKLGSDWRGDPTSALLEVLDPEQNNKFSDHYLEVDYDLSKVMFVATANSFNMPRPLLDRMEVIELSGYTEDEKLAIARTHLIPKQLKETSLKATEWTITDKALQSVIQFYTREAGVRNLEREIAKLTRKAVKKLMLEKKLKKIEVTDKNLEEFLGVPRFKDDHAFKSDVVGKVNGLGWTETGGNILSIEAATMQGGKGGLSLTGKLGDVMKESAEIARSYIRSQAANFGIDADMFGKIDIHVHFPEGATPKDGPSAGIGITTAMVSMLTGIPARSDIAMTGEVTLKGEVLEIGGLKEKLLAALRWGIKEVLIPKGNFKDLKEMPKNVTKGMKITAVDDVRDVLKAALTKPLKPIKAKAAAKTKGKAKTAKTKAAKK